MRGKTVVILLASILSLTILVYTTPVGHSVDWSPDMRLTWKTGMDSNPSLTNTSDGRVWVVWQSMRTGNDEIFYKIYNETDVHPWSRDVQLTNNPSDDITPSVMQAQDGKIWVVWASNRAGNYDIYYKTYTGSAWSPDRPLITNPNKDITPSIMQSKNGIIWVFWSSDRVDATFQIYYQISSDGGQHWTSGTSITDDYWSDSHPSAMQAKNGTIWVVWGGNGQYIYYQLYDGTSWLDDWVQLTDGTGNDMNPSIAQASDGAVWVVWHSLRNEIDDNIYYKTYTTTWSTDTQLTTDESDDVEASVLGTADGTIWIMWASMRMYSFDLYYRTNISASASDVSIFSVERTEAMVVQGKNTTIEVVAQNKGTAAKTFDVKCYANTIPIGTKSIMVDPGQLSVLQFQWNTTLYAVGAYAMKGEAILVDDTYILDNTYTDGTITLVKHDVAIKSVTPSETIAQQGYRLQISVVVKNEGNFTENVKVTAYEDSTPIGSQTKTGLAPNAEATLTFYWTPTVSYGNHPIKATADKVLDEIDLADNSLTGPTVLVTIPGDINGDHAVNVSDLLLMSNYWNSQSYDPNIDVQNDGSIDIYDLFIIGVHFNESW